jgi:hypothetical protein
MNIDDAVKKVVAEQKITRRPIEVITLVSFNEGKNFHMQGPIENMPLMKEMLAAAITMLQRIETDQARKIVVPQFIPPIDTPGGRQ